MVQEQTIVYGGETVFQGNYQKPLGSENCNRQRFYNWGVQGQGAITKGGDNETYTKRDCTKGSRGKAP